MVSVTSVNAAPLLYFVVLSSVNLLKNNVTTFDAGVASSAARTLPYRIESVILEACPVQRGTAVGQKEGRSTT